jgi:predicted ArsR family transcriptional regulator
MLNTFEHEMPVHQGRRSRGTKGQIVSLLRYSPMSVLDLARHTGIAGSTVRRHLDVLIRDGMVLQEPVRVSVGRPKFLFSLTESGTQHFPRNYAGLVTRIISQILLLTHNQTSSLGGNSLPNEIYDRVLTQLIADYKHRITGDTMLERAEQVAQFMYLEGIDYQVRYAVNGDQKRVEMYGLGMVARYEDGQVGRSCRLLSELLDARVTLAEEDHQVGTQILTYLIEK